MSTPPGATARRLDWIDWIRGLAILFVVFFHAVAALVVLEIPAPRWADITNLVVAPYRMPMLMFLSGTLLSVSLRKPRNEYVSGKLRRIGWPYLVWTTVIVVFLIVASQTVGNGNYTLASIPAIILDPTTYTWYLAYLLLFYLLAMVTTPAVRLVAIPVLLAIAFIAADNDGWSRLTFLLAFFFLGDVSSRHPSWWRTLSSRWWWLGLATLVSVGTVWLTIDGHGGRFTAGTLFGVIALLVLARFVAERVAALPIVGALTEVGRDSIVYYTVHWVVIAAAAHVLAAFGVRSGNLALALLMIAGLGVSWVFVWASRRWQLVHFLFVFPDRRGRRPSREATPSHDAAASRRRRSA